MFSIWTYQKTLAFVFLVARIAIPIGLLEQFLQWCVVEIVNFTILPSIVLCLGLVCLYIYIGKWIFYIDCNLKHIFFKCLFCFSCSCLTSKTEGRTASACSLSMYVSASEIAVIFGCAGLCVCECARQYWRLVTALQLRILTHVTQLASLFYTYIYSGLYVLYIHTQMYKIYEK